MSAAISCQLRIADSSSTNAVNAFRRRDVRQQSRSFAPGINRETRPNSNRLLRNTSQLRDLAASAVRVFGWDSDKPVVQLNQLVITQEQLKQIREARRTMLKDGGEAR
ncbi:MAG: hypothetical protein DME71_09540 [Verrucomicrobia bacterium]|nr:MAG: hypothetical protein DME92_05390 [Verrucomicrobiota bacterium]PYJ89502.1 MAG: hypothetical protein DME71_09540 [Verrucomicrobiota bacterium]